MKTWFASYYDGPGEDPVEASVLASEQFISFAWRTAEGETRRHQWNINNISATMHLSEGGTVITCTSEPRSRLVIKGKDAAEFIEQVKAEKAKPWYKKARTKGWVRSLSIFLGFVAILVTAYILLVPWLSEKLASGVSVNTEQQFGDVVYDAMQLSALEDQQASAKVNAFFEEMQVATPYAVRIAVIKGDVVNAFALPGGRIVVYSALLDKLKSYPELAALLSHEFTHVSNRHSTKSISVSWDQKYFLVCCWAIPVVLPLCWLTRPMTSNL